MTLTRYVAWFIIFLYSILTLAENVTI